MAKKQRNQKRNLHWVAAVSSIAAALIIAFIGFRMLSQQMTLPQDTTTDMAPEKQAAEVLEAPENREYEESMETADEAAGQAEDNASYRFGRSSG